MVQKKQKEKAKKNYPEPMEGVDYSVEMPLDMKELLSKLPKYREDDIKYLISKRVIRCFPLKVLDYEVLKRLHNVWATESMVKINAKRMKRKRRMLILERLDKGINTKLDAWLYTKIKKFINKGTEKIPRKSLKYEIGRKFKVKISKKKEKELNAIIDKIVRKVKKEIKEGDIVNKASAKRTDVKKTNG